MATKQDDVQFLMSKVIIHSYIYYVFNSSILTDNEYDTLSIEVAKAIKEKPNEARKHRDYELFEDFDGSTGYGLVGDDSYWLDRANIVMWAYESRNEK